MHKKFDPATTWPQLRPHSQATLKTRLPIEVKIEKKNWSHQSEIEILLGKSTKLSLKIALKLICDLWPKTFISGANFEDFDKSALTSATFLSVLPQSKLVGHFESLIEGYQSTKNHLKILSNFWNIPFFHFFWMEVDFDLGRGHTEAGPRIFGTIWSMRLQRLWLHRFCWLFSSAWTSIQTRQGGARIAWTHCKKALR